MSIQTAQWSISLDTECPACKHDFDVLRTHDLFSDGMQGCESGTERSRDVELICPECDHEFCVDLEY